MTTLAFNVMRGVGLIVAALAVFSAKVHWRGYQRKDRAFGESRVIYPIFAAGVACNGVIFATTPLADLMAYPVATAARAGAYVLMSGGIIAASASGPVNTTHSLISTFAIVAILFCASVVL